MLPWLITRTGPRAPSLQRCAEKSRTRCRAPEQVDDVPLVRFITSMWQALVYAVIVFGAIPLVFSDPLRDRSFRSKASVAGVLIVATNVLAIMLLTDLGRYHHLWPHKAAQIALQVRRSHL